jgi:hypothetical protein
MKDSFDRVKVLYDRLRACSDDSERDEIITRIIVTSTDLLASVERVELTTRVPNKSYFAFRLPAGTKLSRAINANLYFPNINLWLNFIESVKNNSLEITQKEDISRVLYTAAISFCAVNDLFSSGDQKTPGTFFEYYISYLFKLCLKVEPVTEILVLDYDGQRINLQTDKIFNLGLGKPKFHVPVKTSTRERAIMLWAHQKLLDGVYGIEKFMGTPVLLAETKTASKTKLVTEICLPDQWLVYQLYISKLRRVYYLDMPDAYRRLAFTVPPINVKPLTDFFYEWQELNY